MFDCDLSISYKPLPEINSHQHCIPGKMNILINIKDLILVRDVCSREKNILPMMDLQCEFCLFGTLLFPDLILNWIV